MTKGTINTKFDIYPKFIVKNEKKECTEFFTDLRFAGTLIAYRLGKNFTFQIDDDNRKTVMQLWYYITNNSLFNGNHQKGIFLTGNIGTGKTVMLLAFLEVMKIQTGRNYAVLFPETIHRVLQEKGLEYFKIRPLLIDDVCREPNNVQGYWGDSPVKLITMYRNRYAGQNYATGNFKIFEGKDIKPDNEIITRYGAMVFDRIRENYNFLELTGKTRRK